MKHRVKKVKLYREGETKISPSRSLWSLHSQFSHYTCETLNTLKYYGCNPIFPRVSLFCVSNIMASRIGFLGEVSTCAGSRCLRYDHLAPICRLVGCQYVERNP
jgi:hypothetical protein